MFARLGFSVAAHVDPEVLLVDEVLSVGDVVFQRRCMERMEEVLRHGTTVLFVSHNLRAVTDLCGRALLLERGLVAADGPAVGVVQTYLGHALAGRRDVEGRDAYIARLTVRGAAGETASFRSGERAWVDIDITARTACDRLSITLYAADDDWRAVFDTSTERLGLGTIALQAGEAFHCSVQLDLHLAPGTYRIGAALYRYDIQREYDRWFPAATLFVGTDQDVRGVANLYPRVVAFEPGAPPAAPRAPGS
jgi:lipopolysaccharide transport system ATP-binding protein